MAKGPLKPGDHLRRIEVDGRQRSYIVHAPRSVDLKKPAAVVLAFHGGGINAAAMMRFCGLNETADQHRFVAVYPNGTGRRRTALTFNAGNCCGHAMRHKIDDVAFTQTMLDDLAGVLKIDGGRVYATGISNGAMMVYLLAAELSERIAAIAPVAGPMGTRTCSPKRPVPVIHFHGTADDFAPFGGGRGRRSLSRTEFYSVEHSIKQWVRANGCPRSPQVETLPRPVGEELEVTRKTWGPGRESAEVVLYVIEGGGHTWPGRRSAYAFLGPTTKGISANELMWEFFEKHARR